MQAHGSECILNSFGTFWNILKHSGMFYIYSGTFYIRSGIFYMELCSGIFWNNLEHYVYILEQSGTHSGTFWSLWNAWEGCKQLELLIDHGQTDIRTCWAVSSRLKNLGEKWEGGYPNTFSHFSLILAIQIFTSVLTFFGGQIFFWEKYDFASNVAVFASKFSRLLFSDSASSV